MLSSHFGFGNLAASLYALPYIISAILSPILGIFIDKVGKRALFITSSSALILMACIFTTMIPAAKDETDKQWLCLIPLSLLGVGFSIYAAAIWGCIPYTVP